MRFGEREKRGWLLWWVCQPGEARALRRLEFQGRAHRVLWRELAGDARVDCDEKPLDGVLVLDVGGTGILPEAIRPFLLRRLRVNPTAWESVAVLDPGAELLAAQALASAPADVVLLVEGWALSPPRMLALYRQIRATAGPDREVMFLIVSCDPQGQPLPPSAVEVAEWGKFVDSLKDAHADVCGFTAEPAGEVC